MRGRDGGQESQSPDDGGSWWNSHQGTYVKEWTARHGFSIGKYYKNERYEMRASGHRSTAKFYDKGPAADPKGLWIRSLTEDEIEGP